VSKSGREDVDWLLLQLSSRVMATLFSLADSVSVQTHLIAMAC
jgi:hypothetical protein